MADAVDPRLLVEPKKTKYGIVAGHSTAALLYATLYIVWPATPIASRAERFFSAVELCAFPSVLVFLMFLACMRLPDTAGAVNPLLGEESLRWKTNQRILSNTVEQVVIFVPLLLALSLRIDAAHAKLVPIHLVLWVVARVAFALGYRRSPALRAPGMAATSFMSVVTLAWLAWSLVGF